MLARLPVQRPQRIHHIVVSHRLCRPRRLPQLGCSLDGAGIGRPRRQDGALLVQREVGIAHDMLRMLERPRGMQQVVDIELERLPPGHQVSLLHCYIPRCGAAEFPMRLPP